jgi:hypothetical protein
MGRPASRGGIALQLSARITGSSASYNLQLPSFGEYLGCESKGVVQLRKRRLGRRCLLAVVGVTCLQSVAPAWSAGVPSSQQDVPLTTAPAVAAPATNACVLHVWPSADAQSSYTGWFHGGAVDGDKRGIKGYPALHADVLTTGVQRQLLSAIDWRELLGRSNLTVVVHDQPPPAADDQGRTTAIVQDHPGCYQELLVHSVLVERAVFSKTTVRLMVISKDWRGSSSEPSTYSAMVDAPVDLAADADTSLKGGFVESVRKILMTKYFQQH